MLTARDELDSFRAYRVDIDVNVAIPVIFYFRLVVGNGPQF